MTSSGRFSELRDEGKVAEVGLSEVSVADIEQARQIVPIVTVQNRYNVGSAAPRTSSTTARAPDRLHSVGPAGQRQAVRPGGPLDRIAADTGATVSQVCLAWLLRRSPAILPIPGTSSVAHLEENCAAADVD